MTTTRLAPCPCPHCGKIRSFHERLQKLVERAGVLVETGNRLGLSSSVSRSMSARLEHCQRLLDQVEEHLQ